MFLFVQSARTHCAPTTAHASVQVLLGESQGQHQFPLGNIFSPFPWLPPALGSFSVFDVVLLLIQPLKSFDKFHELSGWQNEGQLCSEDEAFENPEFQMAL